MKAYTLKIEDDALWRAVKGKAALKGISIKNLIEKLLRNWIKDTEDGKKA